MALAITARQSLNSNTDASSYTSSSAAVTANRWLVVCVANVQANGSGITPNTPTLSDSSPGLTYNERSTVVGTVGNGTVRRITVFTALSGAGGTFTITADMNGQTQDGCSIYALEVSGGDAEDIIEQIISDTGVGTTPTATLSAFSDSANRPLFFLGAGASITGPEGGYTNVGSGASQNQQNLAAWNSTTADTTPSATMTSAEWKIIAIELKASTAPVVASSTKVSGSTSPLTLDAPSGLTDGDLILVWCHSDESASGTADFAISGFDPVFASIKGGTTAGASGKLLKKTASSEGSTWSVTRTGGSGAWGAIAIRATHVAGTPQIDTYDTDTFDSGDEGTTPSVTTGADNCRIIRGATWNESKTLTAIPSGTTAIQHNDLSSNDGHTIYDTEAILSSGTSAGAKVYDISSGTQTATFTISIKPGSVSSTAVKDIISIGLIPFAR